MKLKNKVIVDIDGTISRVGDRIKYLQQDKKDWDSFYEACGEDEPVWDVINAVWALSDSWDIIFCTGRRESVRGKTRVWIRTHLGSTYDAFPILMRKDSDFRHDTEVKPEMLQEAGIELGEIMLVLEDRNSMVAKWRQLGLTCLQVAEGDF